MTPVQSEIVILGFSSFSFFTGFIENGSDFPSFREETYFPYKHYKMCKI